MNIKSLVLAMTSVSMVVVPFSNIAIAAGETCPDGTQTCSIVSPNMGDTDQSADGSSSKADQNNTSSNSNQSGNTIAPDNRDVNNNDGSITGGNITGGNTTSTGGTTSSTGGTTSSNGGSYTTGNLAGGAGGSVGNTSTGPSTATNGNNTNGPNTNGGEQSFNGSLTGKNDSSASNGDQSFNAGTTSNSNANGQGQGQTSSNQNGQGQSSTNNNAMGQNSTNGQGQSSTNNITSKDDKKQNTNVNTNDDRSQAFDAGTTTNTSNQGLDNQNKVTGTNKVNSANENVSKQNSSNTGTNKVNSANTGTNMGVNGLDANLSTKDNRTQSSSNANGDVSGRQDTNVNTSDDRRQGQALSDVGNSQSGSNSSNAMGESGNSQTSVDASNNSVSNYSAYAPTYIRPTIVPTAPIVIGNPTMTTIEGQCGPIANLVQEDVYGQQKGIFRTKEIYLGKTDRVVFDPNAEPFIYKVAADGSTMVLGSKPIYTLAITNVGSNAGFSVGGSSSIGKDAQIGASGSGNVQRQISYVHNVSCVYDVIPGTPKVVAPAPRPVQVSAPAEATPKLEKQVQIELEVLFDTDKSVIKPEFMHEVKGVADFMGKYPNTTAVIEGHTDSRGDASYNVGLSQRRADAVRSMLIGTFFINPSRLRAVGYGESQPRATNNTDAGRQLNRRTIATINESVTVDAQGRQVL